LNKLDTTEKSAQNYEEKVEYLTREIEDLEITLRDTLKDKEKTKRELEQFKRMSKEKHVNGANSNEAEKKSLIYYKEESARKIAEIQAESSRKSDIIEEMTQRVKVLENKLSAEKHNAEALRTQIHNLKNDMFNLHKKIIDLKTKKSSIESKLSDLEQELIAEKEEKVSLNEKLMKLVSTNDDKSQNSLCEMEVDDLTLDITNPKLHPKRTEILSDFFDLNEDFKEEEFQENNEKLVYFISSPTFSYPKTPNLTFSFCDSLSVLSLKPLEIKKEIIHKGPKTSDEATYDIDNIYKYNNSQEYLDFKNPTKECFIKVNFI
jgi:chromosome segregation ATPase